LVGRYYKRFELSFLELCTRAENPQDGVVHVCLLPKTWQGAMMMWKIVMGVVFVFYTFTTFKLIRFYI
jgi:hypothetical protein